MRIMNRMPIAKRAQILAMLVEGMSLRAVSRVADCSINTVTKLLVDVGLACARFQHKALVNLPCKRIQADEIWAFVGCKEKHVPADRKGEHGIGDVWTWTALCADTKLICTWAVGPRDAAMAEEFIYDLANRLTSRIQLTTDGHRPYLQAVEGAFGADIDYAMLIKEYGIDPTDRRFSAPVVLSQETVIVSGSPDKKHISTSYVERQNLTMRMGMRRFTRLTNAFSKKVYNHECAIALHFMHYNFGRIHKTLRVTPAMEAGLTDHVWSIEEIANLVPEVEAGPRGPYKKRSAT